ncbi:MAG: SAM-dependent methyltransferase, partial [Gemmatimonadaceae bacterium]|nr:SAM-dependent methyltransferase [Chitinophagaceae bacterium]
MSDLQIHPASYRDPAGFVYQVNDTLYRQVNQSGRADFDLLNSSGLYEVLVRNGQLVQHETIEQNIRNDADCYVNLRISPVPFISYPYEWCFAQLRDAALLTITVAKQALDHGMILKDASPFNIQFVCGKPVFIDTLSFKKYDAAKPWVAYRQFCQSFLFPLLLAHYNRFPAQQLMTVYPEGIPVTYIASMLPARSRFSLGVWLHVLLQKNISERKTDTGRKISFNQNKMLQLLSNLESTIKNLRAGYS